MPKVKRRDALKSIVLSPALFGTASRGGFADDDRRTLPIAAVVTEYRTNSHADVIVGKVLDGFRQDGGPGPNLRPVSLYTDQVPANDLSRGLAERHGFRIAKTIDEALTLGTGKLQVAGVLSVGEHGKYPYTPDTKQRMYPRRRFFDAVAATFRRCGKTVPVFNDKHLAYRWDDAKHMYDTARRLQAPLMAGSSLPVTWRVPAETIPLDSEIEDILAVGYGGLESYGFHALEMLQCIAERRRGGETGVASVRAVRGGKIWQAERQGRWSRGLLTAALGCQPEVARGEPEARLRSRAAFYLIDYRDGLKATVAMASGVARHFSVAVKLRGADEPLAIWFKLEETKPYGHFAYLLKAVDHMIHTGHPAYPVERTLLTTGVLDAVMHSLADDGAIRSTPHLAIQYEPADWPFANAAG